MSGPKQQAWSLGALVLCVVLTPASRGCTQIGVGDEVRRNRDGERVSDHQSQRSRYAVRGGDRHLVHR